MKARYLVRSRKGRRYLLPEAGTFGTDPGRLPEFTDFRPFGLRFASREEAFEEVERRRIAVRFGPVAIEIEPAEPPNSVDFLSPVQTLDTASKNLVRSWVISGSRPAINLDGAVRWISDRFYTNRRIARNIVAGACDGWKFGPWGRFRLAIFPQPLQDSTIEERYWTLCDRRLHDPTTFPANLKSADPFLPLLLENLDLGSWIEWGL